MLVVLASCLKCAGTYCPLTIFAGTQSGSFRRAGSCPTGTNTGALDVLGTFVVVVALETLVVVECDAVERVVDEVVLVDEAVPGAARL